MAIAPTPFRIVTDGFTTTVEVDGRDVSNKLAGLTFEAAASDINHLALHLGPRAGTIEGVAVIGQVIDTPTGDLVRMIDPSQVRALHAERMDPVTSDPYAAMLEIVADLLDQMADTDG